MLQRRPYSESSSTGDEWALIQTSDSHTSLWFQLDAKEVFGAQHLHRHNTFHFAELRRALRWRGLLSRSRGNPLISIFDASHLLTLLIHTGFQGQFAKLRRRQPPGVRGGVPKGSRGRRQNLHRSPPCALLPAHTQWSQTNPSQGTLEQLTCPRGQPARLLLPDQRGWSFMTYSTETDDCWVAGGRI